MKTSTTFILALTTLLLFSCSNNSSSEMKKEMPSGFDFGKVENHKYTNSYFNMEISLPDTWVVQSQEELTRLSDIGSQILFGDDKTTMKRLDAAKVNSANLLGVFKYKVGSPVEFNQNLIMVAENINKAPGIEEPADYLFHIRKLMLNSGMDYTIDETPTDITLSSQKFSMVNCYTTIQGIDITQAYYCCIKNGFSLSIILSYNNEEQKEELQTILNSLQFFD